MDARFLDASAHRERSETLSSLPAMAGKPTRTALEDLAHPVQRFHVVFEGRPAEQAHLRDVGWAQPRLATLAFDRFNHRGLFTADVGAGATAQVDWRDRPRGIRLQRRDLRFENLAATVILVAEVDVNLGDVDRPGGDESAFEKPVRVALQVKAILECSRFALVDVDRHQTGGRAGCNRLPFASRRKAGAAEPAQTGILHRRHDFVPGFCAGDARTRKLVTALRLVPGIVDMAGCDDIEVWM